jgi:phenylalanyl-tRNA synthetase beta chain
MKISLSWLSDYVDVDLPIREFLERLTMIGLVAERTETLPSGDAVLEVETYANRPDTLGHLGVAREVATMLGKPLKSPAWPLVEDSVRTADLIDVQVPDEDLCPRYCGLIVRGVKVGPSPDWLRSRIEAMGLRPISNVVDATNCVLFGAGQPIHAFDLAKIGGGRILVRRAKKGERIKTLEGRDVVLGPEMLVIADERRPMAIAGVMGGEETSVTEGTTDIFIESACFDPVSIRKTRKALEMLTDASYRYERGADISFAPAGAVMTASILCGFGGKVSREMIDVYPRPRKAKEIVLRSKRVADLLGVEVGDDLIDRTLASLGFETKGRQAGAWQVQVPFHRVDIEREADLVEEIARFFGYDRIPVIVPALEVIEPVPSDREKLRKLDERLFHYGFDEVINSSFADPAAESLLATGRRPVEVRNPISSRASCLRTTLLGGLLENAAWNRNRGAEGVHIFETGNVYAWNENRTVEEPALGLLSTGPVGVPQWASKPRPADIFYLKGAIVSALSALRYDPILFVAEPHAFFDEDLSLALLYKGNAIGRMGRVREATLEFAGVRGPVFAAEIDLGALFDKQSRPFEYVPLPKFPAIVRDLSFLVDRTVPFREIMQAIEKLAVPHLEEFSVVDHYSEGSIPKGRKSLSLRFTYRDGKATLTSEDADKAEQRIVKALRAAFKIQLREGGPDER